MQLTTFNLESLDLPPKASVSLEVRAEVLRPALERLQADILCLQEINDQHVARRQGRSLLALDQLLAGTAYADYARVTTGHPMRDLLDVRGVHPAVDLPRLVERAAENVLGMGRQMNLHGSRQVVVGGAGHYVLPGG